jgi:integrase
MGSVSKAGKPLGLTDAKIKGLKPPATGQAEHPDALVPGLRVRIGSSGVKTFILRKRIAGRVRNLTLDRYHERRFTLADARKRARAIISDIEAGADPAAGRVGRRRGQETVGTVHALFQDYRVAKARLRSIREVERIFEKYVLPEFGGRLADSITRADVTRLIDGIAASTMARAVAAQLSAFYSWAMPRLERLGANPCRDSWKPAKPPSRDRVLSDAELRAVWKAMKVEPAPFGPAFRLLLITLQRRDEVFSADRAEFDLKAKVWTIPATRAKNGVAHIVPLAPAVVGELKALLATAGDGKLFPARGNAENASSGISKAWERIRAAVGKELKRPVERFTIHDLRRTGATGLQRLGIRLEVTEAVLNHVSGSRAGIVGIYQRHHFTEEKRHALNAWAVELERIVASESSANVVPIRR